MVSCRSNRDAEGFATPAAMVMALTLAVVAAALVLRSTAMLRLAESDLHQTQAEYALSGAQLAAVATIALQKTTAFYDWRLTTGDASFAAHAEPESAKASLAAAAVADDAFFQQLGVADIAILKRRLHDAAAAGASDVASLDASPLWRTCAAQFISHYGGDRMPDPRVAWQVPGPAERATPRMNEIWRIRVTRDDGWMDDRIVRLTGRLDHPAAIIARRFARSDNGGGKCGRGSGA